MAADNIYILTVASGSANGQSWRLGESPLDIGRAATCTLRVSDPLVSRTQCRVEIRDRRPYFIDVSASNPTLVNGEPLREGFLEPGDKLLLGSTLIVVSGEAADAALHRGDSEISRIRSQERTDSVFLASRFESPLHAPGQVSMQDLARLFAFSRRLAQSESEPDLIAHALDEIEAYCDPQFAGFLDPPLRGAEGVLIDRRGILVGVSLNEIMESIDRSEAGKAHLLAGPDETTILIAPVEALNMSFGYLVSQSRPRTAWTDRYVLDFAVALADLMAPFLGTVTRVRRVERENAVLRRSQNANAFVGESSAVQRLLENVEKVAPTPLNVLILGETGTGKELIARLVHDASGRSGDFIVFNCAAIPQDLIESELFGHQRGAFTGAATTKRGLIELADGGTLVLDEVADLSASAQAKLLRVLETKAFRRVGGTEELKSDFRLIAATSRFNTDPSERSEFRLDLFHRLNAVELEIPPLRNRKDDIPLLVDHFFQGARKLARSPLSTFSDEALEVLMKHDWPGNVRELRNAVERAVALAPGPVISSDDIAISSLWKSPSTAARLDEPASALLADVERAHILAVYDACNGDADTASRMLGIGRSTLYNKLKAYRTE